MVAPPPRPSAARQGRYSGSAPDQFVQAPATQVRLPLQFAHVPPSMPQAFFAVPGLQVPPVQQPPQVVASQRQVPPMQYEPTPHGEPVPQPQVPLVRHESARTGSHSTHALPFVPHESGLFDLQTPNSQQPAAQVVDEHVGAEHMPPSHRPLPQETHAAPPPPQRIGVLPVWHCPLKQQPVGHVVESQKEVTQPPSWQLVLPPHEPHAAPPAPQLLGEVPSWQIPCASQQPFGHVVELHAVTQDLCWQLPLAQVWHSAPPVPHAVFWLPPRQTPFWQQPAQFDGPHASSHVPASQVLVHVEHAVPPVPQVNRSVPGTQMPP